MYTKIIKNDISKSKLITITITVFIFLAALLTSLAAMLTIDLNASIDNLMFESKTPHFMQMHSGEIDKQNLEKFADTQGNVADFQISDFLNIEGSEIVIGKHSLADSVQDNGLAKQGQKFDYLLDLDGNVIQPKDGEIYVPLYYMKEGQAKLHDKVTIGKQTFTLAGFLRDSQMNAAMISSKRFLISDRDFEKLRQSGKLESLIEFRLKDTSKIAEFEADYLKAGIESDGPPAITYTLFKVANAVTDGLMIAVLMLISILVIAVTFLCIRLTLLAKIEEDYKEIGVLKAVGIRVADIKKLYLVKYGVLAMGASFIGFLASLILQKPLLANIRLYMGESNHAILGYLFGAIGSAIIFSVMTLYVNGVLRRFRKVSAAQAIRFGAPQEKLKSQNYFQLNRNRILSPNIFLGIKDVFTRKKLYLTMLGVLIISSFIMIVPQNIYNTIASRDFMTYMGIGECQMRIDMQQIDDMPEKTATIVKAMTQDEHISKYTVLTSKMLDLKMPDGTVQHLKVEFGDHSVFPITYSKGSLPKKETEIAISSMNANDLEKTVGDKISLLVNGKEKQLTICGIYSDITNGGKTAKAIFKADQADILWQTIPVDFYDKRVTGKEISDYRSKFTYAKVSDIDDYLKQTFGSTIAAIKKVAYAAIIATILLSVFVTVLFMKMLLAKDRYSIAVIKSIGFTNRDIRRQYLSRSVIVVMLGILIGTILSNTLGELVGVALISSFGVSSFHFVINPWFAYLISPITIAVCVYIGTLWGISDIRKVKISDHIKEV